MRRILIGFCSLLVLVYAGLCTALFVKQRELMYFPQAIAPSALTQTMRLPGADALVLVSVREQAGADALVYFGGNAEDVSRNLPTFSAAFPNHSIYLLHYRRYGGSGGEISEQALVRDGLALFDLVRARHPRVLVIGRSLGSGIAVQVASRRPAIRLVLVTPYDSMVGLAASHYPWFPVRWLLKDKYESWRYAPAVRAPTLILAASDDQVIPRASTDLLLTRFRTGVARMTVVAGTGHNSIAASPDYLPLLEGAAVQSR